ncbi:hypothetical protein BDY17DRAFT_292925 [Neohortaea acidophila]|uniref:AB hydrolase-1 domain-containing protein n=1 Tax=Neohortaea acidophila TaxID=245834 RepID=A0A6A6PY35_9PEZI|nr:uncharacterized protein BDY17DRAFT_292925 [Neohortaea acidophila]KAF2485098.1 hypothetical protein BDY17DRAFT_292925 [Neohortaea acidophila]
MLLHDGWPQYLLLRCIILILQFLGPACVAYTAYSISEAWPEWRVPSVFQAWCALESAFFLFFFLFYRRYLQREATHPPPRTKKQRRALFAKVRLEVHDPDKFFSGWFRGAKAEDIGREDVRVFLNWAFWDGQADMYGADQKELDEYIGKVEEMLRTPFKPGRGSAKSLRLTLDPIEMECRTLAWYGLIMLADTVTHFVMKKNGFQYFKTRASSTAVYPLRPAAMVEHANSPAKGMSYWVRPHTSKIQLPILYVHGIGIGLISSTRLLHELDQALNAHGNEKSDGEVGILAIEILQVSSRLTTPMLRREEFLQQLTQILDVNGYKRFVLASHSYGSVPSTHILTNDKLAKRVASTLFIDPVTVLLHMPDVAYNFTVRQPKTTAEWQLWYFASKDPGIAHTLGRHFFWSENVLWRDRIMELVGKGMKMTASLASKDLIVDTQAVGMYLTENIVPDPVLKEDEDGRKQMELQVGKEAYGTAHQWKHRPWRGNGLEVIWWEGLDHAQVYDQASTRARLIEVLVEYSRDR